MNTTRSIGAAKEATVVIIGGGVMGTSTAYQLARAGIRDIVLLEANGSLQVIGQAPRWRPGTILRSGQHRTRCAQPDRVPPLQRRLRVDIGYQQVGYLFLIRDDADVARYQASIELQNSSAWTAA